MWRQLLDGSGAPVRSGDGAAAWLPTGAELDRAERKLKVTLPGSYRAFCQELGPGELGAGAYTVQIFVPCRGSKVADLVPHVRSGRASLRFAIEQSRETARHYGEPEIPAEFVPDLTVAFAADHDGASFFWRIDEATGEGEYAIYALADEVPPRVLRIADSFTDFVRIAARGPQGLVDAGLYGSTAADADLDERGFWPLPVTR